MSAKESAAQMQGDPPASSSDPREYLVGNMLSTGDEERAVEVMVKFMREGNQRDAMQLFFGLHGYRIHRRPHTGIASDLVDERAFDRNHETLSKKWTDLLLEFHDPHADDYAVYKELMSERRRATKSLYQSLAGLRYQNRQIDIGSESRQSKRSSLAAKILSSDSTDVREIEKLLNDVDDSLAVATRQLAPSYTDRLSTIHNADLSRLVSHLPDHCAIIDIVAHDLILQHNAEKTINEATQTQFTAFVITKKTLPKQDALSSLAASQNQIDRSSVSRINLGSQKLISKVARQWLSEIRESKPSPNTTSQLSSLLWEPLEPLLGGVDTIYLVADGILHDLPWDILPIENGKRLLVEKYKLAELPFCEYLLQAYESGRIDCVSSKMNDHPTNMLVVGGVSQDLVFGSAINKHLVSICPERAVVSLEGADANVENVTTLLPDFSVAHFATHGMFSQSALSRARQHGKLEAFSPQQGLLFSFLVLHEQPNESRFVSAYQLSELDLGYMDLAVLAACETQVGEDSYTEGRFSLPRSFHLAGCRDVVSTLWSVDDFATSRFMERFHSELQNGRPPSKALQLTKIAALKGEIHLQMEGKQDGQVHNRTPVKPDIKREATDFQASTAPKLHELAPVSLWAGFRLSGPGNLPVVVKKIKQDKSHEHSRVKWKIEKQWNRFEDLDGTIDDLIREELRRNPLMQSTGEDYVKKLVEKQKQQVRQSANEYSFIVSLESRYSDSELTEIANQLYPDEAEERDTVSINFHLFNVPIGGTSYGSARFASGKLSINRSGLTELERQSFFRSPVPSNGRVLGCWQDEEDAILQVENRQGEYMQITFRPNGEVVESQVFAKRVKPNHFTMEVGQTELSIEKGNLCFYQFGRMQKVCRRIVRPPLSEKEAHENAEAVGREKELLRSFLDRILEVKDDPNYTSFSISEGGRYHDFYLQLAKHCTTNPTNILLPFEMRIARHRLIQLLQCYLRDKPGLGQRTTGEGAALLGVPTEEQLLESIRKVINEVPVKIKPIGQEKQSASSNMDFSKLRTWTDASGKFSVEATLISASTEIVRLRKRDGQVIDVPLSKLSKTEQDLLRSRAASPK